ncbi:MAG: hypothetical protein GVY13_01710 [Alphaproteobacteria bacterium]|nr:hypothetical protein [Alphaproteobacteria bacterium]
MPTLESLVAWARNQVRFDGRFGLSLRAERRGTLFVPLVTERETFFRDGQGIAGFRIADNPDLPDFLDGRSMQTLSYGYPVHVDAGGLVTPLFFVEVTVSLSLDTAQLRKTANRRPRLSRRALVESGHDPAMADAACRTIEHGSFPSLEACLAALAGHLNLTEAALAEVQTEAFPESQAGPGWYRTPILFVSPSSPLQRAQLGELERLPHAYASATHMTALHALVARRSDRPEDGAGRRKADQLPLLEIDPLSEAASQQLEHCLSAGLSVVEASPGGEREAFIADAIANLVVSGQSVLYIHPVAEMTDEVVERFQGLLARRQTWIPRLGGEEILARLSRTADELEAERPTGIAPPSKQARQRALAEPKGELATARGRIESSRSAIRALAECRAERQRLRAGVEAAWQPVFAHADKLAIGGETAAAAESELRALTGERPGLFGRLFGRKETEARVRAMAGTATDAVAGLPDTVWAGLPLPDRNALGDPATAEALADAFAQLRTIARWRELGTRETELLAEVRRLPPAARIAEQLAQAESRLARDSQGLLRDVWRAAIAKGAAKSGEKLAAVFQAISDRRFVDDSGEDGPDPAGDQQLAKFLRLLVRNYPLWAAPADLVPSHLPLTDGLFDMAIVDDAGTVTAGALLPLLLRVRHAMVLAPVDRDRQPVNSGFSLAAASETAKTASLAARMRQHPAIVRYLSAVFHGGGLSLQGTESTGIPAADPGISGLHWHPIDAPGLEAEVQAILALLQGWTAGGLFDGEAPVTVGVAVPVAGRLAALEDGVLAALPEGLSEESLLFGPPGQFQDLELAIMILVPGLERGMPAGAAEALAWNRELFHDAAAAAERGLHAVGDADSCSGAGGFAAALVEHCGQMTATDEANGLARLCTQAGLSWRPVPAGLEVVGRFGGLYRFVKDAPQPAEIAAEEAEIGLKAETFTFLLSGTEFSEPPQWLTQLLERLC